MLGIHLDGPCALADPDAGHGNDVARLELLRVGGLRERREDREQGGEDGDGPDAQWAKVSALAATTTMSRAQDKSPGQSPAMTVIACTPARHDLPCPCTTSSHSLDSSLAEARYASLPLSERWLSG